MANDFTPSSGKIAIPRPADPDRRQQPLPWCRPKSADEDPDALSRIKAILASASYVLAEQDLAFLARDEARGVRLQLEYLKPETLLAEHAVRDTVVVYGSTRIAEPAEARRCVEALCLALETDPRNTILIRKLAVAERILAKSRYYEVAREFGHLVGSCCNSDGSRLVIMTGGGPGIMEAANRGAFEVGAQSVGLNINLPHEQYPNPYITPELCFRFHYFALRKMHFLLRAKALVAFPGWFWDAGRAVRSLDPGADAQDQAGSDRAGGRRVLEPSHRRRVSGRRRCNRR
jgi:predicted Rossmann-fold nucleotide-binding protein